MLIFCCLRGDDQWWAVLHTSFPSVSFPPCLSVCFLKMAGNKIHKKSQIVCDKMSQCLILFCSGTFAKVMIRCMVNNKSQLHMKYWNIMCTSSCDGLLQVRQLSSHLLTSKLQSHTYSFWRILELCKIVQTGYWKLKTTSIIIPRKNENNKQYI